MLNYSSTSCFKMLRIESIDSILFLYLVKLKTQTSRNCLGSLKSYLARQLSEVLNMRLTFKIDCCFTDCIFHGRDRDASSS